MTRFIACIAALLGFAGQLFAVTATTIQVGTVPGYLAVNATTNRIYVSNLNSNNVSVIDGSTNTVITTVVVGNSPSGIAVNPTTNLVYVVNLIRKQRLSNRWQLEYGRGNHHWHVVSVSRRCQHSNE
jgi:YVTN family beta-propeller protein